MNNDLVTRLEDYAAKPSTRRSVDEGDELMREAVDKIEGLKADLRNAVQVAYRRGAVEWARLNYPEWAEHFAAEMRATLADEGTREA